MLIVVNTRAVSGDNFITEYLQQLFIEIAAGYPQHQFILVDAVAHALDDLPANLQSVYLPPSSQNPLFWKIWYNYKLPALLRKLKADVLISAEGIVSLRCKQPQWLLVNEPAIFTQPATFPSKYMRFFRSNRQAYLQKAAGILCFTAQAKTAVAAPDSALSNKITVLPPFVSSEMKPISYEEKATVLADYTEGYEFFLYRSTTGSSDQLVTLLKGFSVFKKRLKSSLRLLVIASGSDHKKQFAEQLRLYKYRQDVHLFSKEEIKNMALVVAAAWASVQLSPLQSGVHMLLESIACGIPVIAPEHPSARAILQDAALYFDPAAFEQAGQQLITVYKDEALHSALAAAALQQAASFSNSSQWMAILGAGTK